MEIKSRLSNNIKIFTIIALFQIIFGKKTYFSNLNKENKIPLKASKNEITIKGNKFYEQIVLEKKNTFTIHFDEDSIEPDVILTILGNSLINFEIIPYNIQNNRQVKIDLPIQKYFHNGYGLIIDEKILKNYNNLRLELKLLQYDSELIYIRTRPIKSNKQNISPNDHIDIILKQKDFDKECFSIYQTREESIYSFKFLTYTKHIKALLQNEERDEEFEINKEYMTYIIKDNQYDKICFELNGNNETNKAGLSIELLNLNITSDENSNDKDNIVIYNEFTLVRGLATEHYLPKGYALIYKADDYIFKDLISFININFYMVKGISKLFVLKCKDYPHCKYKKEDLTYNNNNYEDINGYITVKKDFSMDSEKGKNYIVLIYCPEDNNDDCKYEISIKNEEELTYLYKNQISYSYINSYNEDFYTEYYKIDLENDFIENSHLLINLNIFSGNVNFQILDSNKTEVKEYQKKYLGNKVIYILKNDFIEENLNLYIKITKDQNSYFNIKYELKKEENMNEYYLEEGILLFGKLKQDSYNNYIISNSNKNLDFPFIITINTFGCNFEINDENSKANIKMYPEFNLIQLVFKEEINDQYNFNIVNNEKYMLNKDYEYSYNIILSSINTKIQIQNGQIYKNQLNKINKEVTYIYTFTKRTENNNKLIIHFRKFSQAKVIISINILVNKYKNYIINRLSKTILLNDKDIKNTCSYFEGEEELNACKVIIKIKNEDKFNITKDPSTFTDFSIQITGNDETFNPNPIYLPQNNFISNILIPDFRQIYFIDVIKGGTGKIYIDFLEGGGNTYGILQNKKLNIQKEIDFDYFNKYYEIPNILLDNCINDGDCKLYIYIFTIEYMYKYNIYSKTKINNEETIPFNVPEYEYIYGDLIGNEIHKYFTKISKQTDSIIFNVNCDNCEITINYNGRYHSFETSGNKQFTLDYSFLGYTIIDFYGSVIYYSIKIKDIELTSEQNYNLRIITPGLHLRKIIPMTSLRNEICKIDKYSPCYYIIPIEKYNKIDKIRFYIPDNEDTNIYYKAINYIDFDKYDEIELLNQINSIFVNNSNIDFIKKNYFEKKINRNTPDDVDYEIIYIIKVELNYPSEIKVISSHYNIMNYKQLSLQLNDYTLLKLDNINKNISLITYNKGFYDIEVNLIKGKGEIKELDKLEKSYLLDYKIQENIHILVDSEVNKIKKLEAKKYEGEEEFIVYIRILLSNYHNNIVELNFQKNNYFNYLDINYKKNLLPLYFYMKLNISSEDIKSNNDLELKNINLNYKFSNINNDAQIQDYSKQIFYIDLFSVNQSYINKIKLMENIDLLREKIKCESNYRIDITTGYSFIRAKNLTNYINNNNNYLFIRIYSPEKININNIDIMFSSFDLTGNYYFPINEYLTMSINQITKLNLGRKMEIYNNSIIEFILDDNNFNYSIISSKNNDYYNNDTSINSINNDFVYFGKTIINKIFLKNEKNNILFLYPNKKGIQNKINTPNLLIKYRLSNSNKMENYFILSNPNVIFEPKDSKIYFSAITGKSIKDIKDETKIIYNIRIYDYSNNTNSFSNSIFNNEKPYKFIKYINPEFGMLNFIKIEDLPNGLFYLSILAEARKGNIYEYFTYNPFEINIVSNVTYYDIIINKNESKHEGRFSKSFIYRAFIEKDDGDFIKLSLKHKKNLDQNNYIFVSNKKDFISSENLYKDSEFKTIDRETSLIIPIKKVINSELYIRIPCSQICDYAFNYTIYKTDSIKIKDDECFDFDLMNNKQKFIYSLKDRNNLSLFTFTSYSIKDFKVYGKHMDKNLNMDKTYFNGYSFVAKDIINYSDNKLIFSLEGDSIINICHHTLSKKNLIDNEKYDNKEIVVGDKVYTRVENNKKECFQIHKIQNEAINNYLITFISKTKNIKVEYNSENYININEESDSVIFNSDLKEFCISTIKSEDNNGRFKSNDAGVLIHLLSFNKDNIINQTLSMPLIKGISTRQILKRGQLIYYRINENTINSKSINIHFQNITGATKVYYSKCINFPDCSFSLKNINNKTEQIPINNNIYFNLKIENGEEDIYHKSTFPVVIVYCSNEDIKEDFCNYYIEMSNDNDIILLNKNRKIYSFIKSNEEEYRYKINIPKYGLNNKNKLFIQIHSFFGNTNILIDGIKPPEEDNIIDNYYQFNNNTIFFIYNLDNKFNELNELNEFNIKVTGDKNSYYSIFYYIINENNENERKIYLPSGEMHYSIITKPDIEYFYYFKDKNQKNITNHYLITINPINCNLNYSYNGEKENERKNNQFIMDSNDTIKLFYSSNLNKNDTCEFSISAVEITHNRDLKNFKELIINEGIYQNYYFENKERFNSTIINYLISKEDISNQNILIYIKKKSALNLIFKYYINNKIINKTISDYNEIIEINLNEIKANNYSLEELYNFRIIKIIIYLEKGAPQINVDFKIKINGRNLPSYLNAEEIEYGLINKGKYIYYYLDYQQNEKFQIYFDCKGIANFKVIQNIEKNKKEKKSPNNLYYNNKYNLPTDNFFKDKDNRNYNYAVVDECSHSSCQAYIVIYISESEEYNEKTLFNIYRYSENNILNIPLNQNIYGVLLYNTPNILYTDINFKREPIKIILNCKKCKMCYYTEEPKDQREKETNCNNLFEPKKDKYLLIKNDLEDNINKINFRIFSDNQKEDEIIYYSIYIMNNNYPKYIVQNAPEICEIPCKLILPIYEFYYFNNKNIILYVPDDEQTIIEAKIRDFGVKGNYIMSSDKSLISNRLIINLEDITQKKDLFIEIQINSKINEIKNITFIVSQFYNSLNTEIIPYTQNIFIINRNNSKENNIVNNLIKNNLYKIDLSLIEGNGLIYIKNDNEIYKYSLSFDSHDRISLILKSNNIYLEPENNSKDKNFIFYMNVEENDNNNDYDELIFRKTNNLNYFKDENKSNIFPIKLKLKLNKNQNINDLHINFRFSQLLNQNISKDTLINTSNEKFDIKVHLENNLIKTKNISEFSKAKEGIELKEISKYYSDLRRGYIYLNKDYLVNITYIDIIIAKNELNIYNYERVSLDITPFEINSKVELPRNNYLEMKINSKNQEIKLSKPLKEYKNLYLELSSNENIQFSIEDIESNTTDKTIYGKNNCSITNDNKTEYTLNLNSKNANIGTILLKYITKKDNIIKFNLNKSDIEWKRIDEDNNTFHLNYSNILTENKSNYSVSYLIRLYNSFSFDNNKLPKNILVEEMPKISFRKDLTLEELKNDFINCVVDFGHLNKSKYYISVLGEVVNDGNVEYFSYDLIDFNTIKIIKKITFDFTWIIIILILLFILIFSSYYLIKVFISMKNKKGGERFLLDKERNSLLYRL